jgi:hypothetical protein
MGGGDDSRIQRNRLGAAKSLNGPLFQYAQQLDLDVERQLADFIEKNRRLIGQLEAPDLPRYSAGVGAFFAAEQLAFDKGCRNGRAVDPHHRSSFTGAQLMNLRREQFLAGARLSEQQHGGIGRRHLLHLLERFPDRRARAEDCAGAEPLGCLLAQIRILRHELIAEVLDLTEGVNQRAFVFLAAQGSGKHGRQHPQTVNRVGVPATRPPHRVEADSASDLAVYRQRHRQQ